MEEAVRKKQVSSIMEHTCTKVNESRRIKRRKKKREKSSSKNFKENWIPKEIKCWEKKGEFSGKNGQIK